MWSSTSAPDQARSRLRLPSRHRHPRHRVRPFDGRGRRGGLKTLGGWALRSAGLPAIWPRPWFRGLWTYWLESPRIPSTLKPQLQREVRDWEPHLALFGGLEGLDMYRRLIAQAEEAVRPGGWLLFELGTNMFEPVRALLGDRWDEVEVSDDFAGFQRVLAARLKP